VLSWNAENKLSPVVRAILMVVIIAGVIFYCDAIRRTYNWWQADVKQKRAEHPQQQEAAVIDRSGNLVPGAKPRNGDEPPRHNFSNGPKLHMIEWDKFEFVDEAGKRVFGKTFANARPFSEGFAAVSDIAQSGLKEDRNSTLSFGSSPWRYIDKSGNVVFGREFGRVSEFHAGRAIVTTLERAWNPICIDAEGKTVFDVPTYTDIYPYSDDGFAIVSTGFPPLPCGLIDTNGKLTVKDLRIENFSEGLGAFRDRATGRYGYIDAQGNIAIKPRFFVAMPFSEGLAAVSDLDTAPTVYEYSTCSRLIYSYIDKAGNKLPLNISPSKEIQFASNFEDGKATVYFYRKNHD
jgi:hypothetical protein